jgi:phytoene synthase
MYGSAAVIGLMMCQLMGKVDDVAIPYAHALGDAMQMTNFLRDIKEDYLELDRIYLPSDDLSVF